jgi:type III secretion protein S
MNSTKEDPMQNQELAEMLQRAMFVLMITAAPAVVVSAVVGLLVAVVQAATQLQDQSISQALKLGAVLLVLIVSGGWMSTEVWRFADRLIDQLPTLARSK